jgi:hypothetical protein
LEGRTILEKRLGELIKASKESKPEWECFVVDMTGRRAPGAKVYNVISFLQSFGMVYFEWVRFGCC